MVLYLDGYFALLSDSGMMNTPLYLLRATIVPSCPCTTLSIPSYRWLLKPEISEICLISVRMVFVGICQMPRLVNRYSSVSLELSAMTGVEIFGLATNYSCCRNELMLREVILSREALL